MQDSFLRLKRTKQVYSDMKQRCYNRASGQYKNYGARGISVCDRWLSGFQAFFEDMGLKPEGMTLDRIDNEKGYSPENCRWASAKDQGNNKRNCRVLTHEGRRQTVTQWADELGISPLTIFYRIQRGYCESDALYPGKYSTSGKQKKQAMGADA